MNETERTRRERLLFAVLLLFGIVILLCVGQAAIGIAPNWEVAANMRSNLDPNSDFLTRKNSGIVEPLNPDILTLPAWLNILLTPNATLPTNAGITPPATRAPTRASTQAPTQPATLQPTIAYTLPATASTIYVPPPTKPGNTSTPTNIPIPSANLAIAKTDGSTTYMSGNAISYQIVVTNSGPNAASGFSVTDAVPAVINITSVSCAPSGTASCGTNGSAGNNVSFTGMSVNASAGDWITITINGTVNAGATGNLVNAVNIVIPGGASFSDPNTSNNIATDTDTPFPSADLVITKTDGNTTYMPGDVISYQIAVTNGGPDNASAFSVTDAVPAVINISSVSCASSGTANCGTDGTIGNNVSYTGMAVNAGAGNQVTITITGTVGAGATGDLVNTADIVIPGGAGFSDPNTGNNTATDTDITIDPLPAEIGTSPDSIIYNLVGGGTLTLNIPIVVNGHAGPDLIYYEFPAGTDPGILLDWVIIEIGDGTNWYTVFNWYDNLRDTNTNVDYNLLPPPPIPSDPIQEPDERVIPAAYLSTTGYSTGVAIDLDGVLPLAGIIPSGTYPYLRISSPAGGVDNKLEIDAIVALP